MTDGTAVSRRQLLVATAPAAAFATASAVRAGSPAAADDGAYDVSDDILAYRRSVGRDDYQGDNVPLQRAANQHTSIFIPPDRVGGLDLRRTVRFLRRSARLVVGGGAQAVPLVRHPSHDGDTFVFGDENNHPAGDIVVENLWFVHPGRLGYGADGMVDAAGTAIYPEGSPLPNRLVDGQAHLRVHGAQHATLRRVGGWGMPHIISLHGCAGVVIDQPFTFGSVFDDEHPSAQEGLSHICLASGSKWGANSAISIRQPQLYGQNRTKPRKVSLGERTIDVPRRIGPRSIYLINSCEDWEIIGGFAGQANGATLQIEPDSPQAVIFNGLIMTNLDESNKAAIRVRRPRSDYRIADGLTVIGSFLNGQQISERGIVVESGPAATPSLRNLHVGGGTVLRAFLGGGAYLAGVEAGSWHSGTVRGYNGIGSKQSQQGGIVIDGMTSDFDVADVRFGGGINGARERRVGDAFGRLADGTVYGLVRMPEAMGANVTHGRLLRFAETADGFQLVAGAFDPSS